MPFADRPMTLAALLLILAACASPGRADQAAPYLPVPLTSTPPVLDGRIDAQEWEAASCLAAFTDFLTHDALQTQPHAWVMRDREALYLAARLPLGQGDRPVARAAGRDGAVWADDAVEVFLAPDPSGTTYYQFIANSAGGRYDARGQDASWNADWDAKALVAAEGWSVEFRFPFSSLGVAAPKDGDIWGLNVAWDRQGPAARIGTWAPVERSFHEPARFGRAAFVDAAPAIQVVGPSRSDILTLAFAGVWRSVEPLQAALKVEREEGGKPVVVASEAAALNARETRPFRIEARLPEKDGLPVGGTYHVALTVTQAGRPIYAVAALLAVAWPLQLRLRNYPLEGTLEAAVDASGLPGLDDSTSTTVAVVSPEGKPLRSERLTLSPQQPQGALTFEVGDLPPGRYEVAATAPGLPKPITAAFTRPVRPAWLGSKQGLSEQVLPPWTPVRRQADRVKVWGREYRFGPLPFPAEVTAAEQSILAGPITLQVVADGKARTWPATGEVRSVSAKPNRAVLATKAAGDGIVCEGRATTEYDGMVRSDFTIRPTGVRTIEELSLVVPIKEEHAKYLCYFPGSWGASRNAAALPPEGFTSAFKPFVWLGDEDRGFAWFSESDRNFALADANQAIGIERRDGVVTLRISMITAPQPAAPLDYTFGFQATPVKPLQPDVWDYRICHHGSYGIEDQPWQTDPVLTYPAEGLVNPAQGTFEAWVRPKFDLQPQAKPEDPSRGRFNRNLLEVRLQDESRLGLYWNVDDRGMRMYYRQGPERHTLVFGTPTPWQPGEWHHVALTWGPETVIYLDGRRAAAEPYRGSVEASLAGAEVVLGAAPSDFDLDEVRISDVPCSEFDLTRPPVADQHTLLLDHLDTVIPATGDRHTSPERGRPGVAGGGSTVEGKFGKAYALHGGETKTLLDRLAELGVRTICFHEHWTDIQNYTSTTHGEALHKLVQACHAHGIKLLLYFGYLMSDLAPEWETYSNEVLVAPRQGDYHREPDQMCYSVCYRSAWQDFLADGIARMVDEYDIDGVYLDGTEYPWGCSNTHHGCGYRRPDGSIGPTYTLFTTRDMMRRLYTIVKGRKPEGELNVHNSTCMTIPTLAWATSSWDGEQFGGIDRGPNALDVLPLDSFRAEFMGRQWGVPAEFLCYNRPYTMSEALSFTLLHDVLVRGSLGGSLEMESKLWQGMEAFGRHEARWLPYWANAEYVTLGPDDTIKASLYSQGAKGVVAVVSNLGKVEQTAWVQLNKQRLSLSAQLRATDMITGEAVPIAADGGLSFRLPSFGFRVVWVKP